MEAARLPSHSNFVLSLPDPSLGVHDGRAIPFPLLLLWPRRWDSGGEGWAQTGEKLASLAQRQPPRGDP